MTELAVLAAGPATSLQDAGRFGWQRFGVGPAGAMDRLSLALANVARRATAPGRRRSSSRLLGGRLQVSGGSARVALAGADCALKIDGQAVAPLTSATAHDGQTIEVGAARAGMFAYLAVAGGFTVTRRRSAPCRCTTAPGVGGLDGRPLRAGDRLPLAAGGTLRTGTGAP